jgi:sulfur-oxidizing protein SoxX
MNRMIQVLVLTICIGALTACITDPKSSKGFRLPDGNAQAGQAVFIELQCNACHQISGLDLPAPVQSGPVKITLGGTVRTVRTYGELVSSVVNPSHKLIDSYPEDQVSREGKSLMTVYNDRMTVQQLIDLVAFLQSRYDVIVPDYSYSTYRYQ